MSLTVLSLILLYLQASIYARSIDSLNLDQLVKSSIKQNRPVFIILDPPESLTLSDKGNDDSNERFEDMRDAASNILRKTRNPDLTRGEEDCKQLLRTMIGHKCSDDAQCTEVVWKVAKELCDRKQEQGNVEVY